MEQITKTKSTAHVGEEIGRELGAQFISSYRSQNPTDAVGCVIGRNILEQILAQPGCAGIVFYYAYNEKMEKTLVYVGVDAKGNDLLSITSINTNGQLENYNGIVADRGGRGGQGTLTGDSEPTWWDL